MDTKNPMSEYCYGTIPIYNQAYKMLAGRSEIDTIFVNLHTLIRNVVNQHAPAEMKLVKSGEKKQSEAADLLSKIAIQEIGSFLYDLAALLNRTSPVPLAILSYRYLYKNMIPEKFLRNKDDQILSDVLMYINERYYSNHTTYAKYKNVVLNDVCYSGNNIVTAFTHEVEKIGNQKNVLMISHHPIDYHMATACNSWRVIKSYTGAIWTYEDLGINVLHQNLPYLKKLHILLGDKTDLKPSLPLKEREKLIKVAQDESWYLLPEDKIEERLRQLNYLTPYTF